MKATLRIEVEEHRDSEGKERGEGTQRAMGDLEFLTQDAEPRETTLVYARNGFNEPSCLAMLWTVRHRCPERARFTFNCYRHWAQLLLHHPGDPVHYHQEGVSQCYPLSAQECNWRLPRMVK